MLNRKILFHFLELGLAQFQVGHKLLLNNVAETALQLIKQHSVLLLQGEDLNVLGLQTTGLVIIILITNLHTYYIIPTRLMYLTICWLGFF